MPKRISTRSIRAARTFTIEEAAEAAGVSVWTVRNWVKAGLPLMASRRPYLILGEHLRGFIEGKRRSRKEPLQDDQLYCLSCKAGRKPMGQMVDCLPQSPRTARLVGLCEVCGGTCNRMISRSRIEAFARIFDLVIRDGPTA